MFIRVPNIYHRKGARAVFEVVRRGTKMVVMIVTKHCGEEDRDDDS